MDLLLALKAAVMGVVEGLTEFLPISSTGHLIVAGSLIDFRGANAATFEVAIQSGAMLAVLWEYRARIGATIGGIARDAVAQRFAVNVLVAFLPALVLGALFGEAIKSALFRPMPVAIAFVVGALVILWVERRRESADAMPARIDAVDAMTWRDALKVGLAQCFAMIPGTSRAGATIIGGLLLGMSRPAATEFSFYLALPTLFAAGAYALWKARHTLSSADAAVLVIGTLVAFASALVCIRWLIRYVSTHSFRAFAWYRIAFGVVILATAELGWVDWS
jgi:undecaprenyl-diphosphatase